MQWFNLAAFEYSVVWLSCFLAMQQFGFDKKI
jgi:hypothetical protein